MSYSDLLDRMRERDTDAFLEMTDRYGWALYASIRRKNPDKVVADRIYSETMNEFYRVLQNPACDDPVEALLFAFSDNISVPANPVGQHGSDMTDDPMSGEPPKIVPSENIIEEQMMTQKNPRKSHLLTSIGFVLVTAGIFFMLWVILGLLMSLEIIPAVDLGYAWFNANIARWF